jgi:hypothetical protein
LARIAEPEEDDFVESESESESDGAEVEDAATD